MKIDIVIPYSSKDDYTIKSCINSLSKLKERGNVFIISKEDPNVRTNIEYSWINEDDFHFTKESIINANNIVPEKRSGWYFQQFLKLYCCAQEQISDTFLVLDSDVIFLKEVSFVKDGKLAYNYSSEYTPDYFNCMSKLNSYFERSVTKSGICHHMIFEKKILDEIFSLIQTSNEEIYETIMKAVDNWHHGFSEYELYFHYIFKKYPKEYALRYLRYADVDDYKIGSYSDYDYIANHEWKRNSK